MMCELNLRVRWLLFVAFIEFAFSDSDTVEDDCQWNEVIVECGGCEATCEQTELDPLCHRSCKPRRCECVRAKGFVRAKDGACIPIVDCRKYTAQYISPGRDPRISPDSLLGKLLGELRRELIEEYQTGRSINHRRQMMEHFSTLDFSREKKFNVSDRVIGGTLFINEEDGLAINQTTNKQALLNDTDNESGSKVALNAKKEADVETVTVDMTNKTVLSRKDVKDTLDAKGEKKEVWRNFSSRFTEFPSLSRIRFVSGADPRFEVRCLPHCCEPPCGSCKPPCGQNCPPPCN